MSVQRAVSSAGAQGSTVRLIAAVTIGVALGAAVVLVTGRGRSELSWRRIAARAASPNASHVAFVLEQPCSNGFCQTLHLGESDAAATRLEALEKQSSDQVVWAPDGKRVGFVVDGRELWLYDVQARTLAGRVGLLTSEAAQSRMARGITFSENGRAATFDDCPRRHSGCRAGVVGIPQ
jgi:hypothetical protein